MGMIFDEVLALVYPTLFRFGCISLCSVSVLRRVSFVLLSLSSLHDVFLSFSLVSGHNFLSLSLFVRLFVRYHSS